MMNKICLIWLQTKNIIIKNLKQVIDSTNIQNNNSQGNNRRIGSKVIKIEGKISNTEINIDEYRIKNSSSRLKLGLNFLKVRWKNRV